MGNQICCEEVTSSKQDKIIIYVNQPDSPTKTNIKPQPIEPQLPPQKQFVSQPELTQNVRENLQKYKPFFDQIKDNGEFLKIKSAVYSGPLNQYGRPEGYGKMFYPKGSVLVGRFVNGAPDGPVHYVWPNGSFYKGNAVDHKANDKFAVYECEDFAYSGSILDNNFQGQGSLKAKDDSYRFSGVFQNGKRKQGKLIWKQADRANLPLSGSQIVVDVEYTYEGSFDENEQFTGKGVLTGPKGVYKGQFVNGMKHGQGVFEYANGLVYEGTYKNDERDGTGKIISKSKTVSFEGEMKNGLPHGKGRSPDQDGNYHEVTWREGISSIIEDSPKKP